jgi:DNA polymerase/3'-5' exonuclease PolX
MELQQAQNISHEIIEKLKPYCSRIQVAGSIRRKKPFVHDIDVVCIPSNQGKFLVALQELGKIKSGAGKLINVITATGPIDFYIATSETWATLLLIRTGSKEHNIMLCKRARDKGMKLHADGRGLEKCLAGEGPEIDDSTTSKIVCDTEESIFQALGLKYKEPWERN